MRIVHWRGSRNLFVSIWMEEFARALNGQSPVNTSAGEWSMSGVLPAGSSVAPLSESMKITLASGTVLKQGITRTMGSSTGSIHANAATELIGSAKDVNANAGYSPMSAATTIVLTEVDIAVCDNAVLFRVRDNNQIFTEWYSLEYPIDARHDRVATNGLIIAANNTSGGWYVAATTNYGGNGANTTSYGEQGSLRFAGFGNTTGGAYDPRDGIAKRAPLTLTAYDFYGQTIDWSGKVVLWPATALPDDTLSDGTDTWRFVMNYGTTGAVFAK